MNTPTSESMSNGAINGGAGVRAMNESGQKLLNDVRGFIGDAEELLRAVSEFSGETVAGARAKFTDKLEQVKGLVGEGQDLALTQAREAAESADQYVHRYPWQAIGIGVAVGIAIGWLSHRQS